MLDISETTGEIYYSGTWEGIQDILRVLNIGEGKMSQVTQEMVNRYQEMVDRDIDALLQDAYQIPIRAYNMVQQASIAETKTIKVFPGDVRRAAKYWAAGHLLVSEFQQLESNLTEQATEYVSDARNQVYAMARPTHRIPGQRRKSNISHTMPANMQPNSFPERPN